MSATPALEAEAGGSLRARARADEATELILASSGGREGEEGEKSHMGLQYSGRASTPVSIFFLVHRGGLALHKPLASCSSWGWVGQLRRLG